MIDRNGVELVVDDFVNCDFHDADGHPWTISGRVLEFDPDNGKVVVRPLPEDVVAEAFDSSDVEVFKGPRWSNIIMMLYDDDPDCAEGVLEIIGKYFPDKEPLRVVEFLLHLILGDDTDMAIKENMDWFVRRNS